MSILVGMTPLAILNDVYRIILMFFVVVVVDFLVFLAKDFPSQILSITFIFLS